MTNYLESAPEFPSSSTIFGIPSSHWHCSLNNLRWPSPAVKTAIIQFMQLLDRGDRSNLLLTGTSGLGKTHLSVGLYRWGALRWGTIQCAYFTVPQFLNEVKQTFEKKDGEDPFRDIFEAKKLVVLDDLVGRSPTPWERDHVIFRLINTAYINSASLVATTNLSLLELGQVLQPHEMSRLLEGVIHIEFKGKDQRLGGPG